MAKKKNITAAQLTDLYMDYVLENQAVPKSVYQFAKSNNFDESKFYTHFGTFEALEKQIFTAFFDQTITLLENNKEYRQFDARNKLLSFYFTFFELLTANRSYVVHVLSKKSSNLKSLKTLSGLRKSYLRYIENLELDTFDLGKTELNKFKEKSVKEGGWLQLLITIKFWLDDESPDFEKTDIFIEKSINTGFELMNTAPVKSLIDLGKFLIKEKMGVTS